ncbi:hypothetical protein ACVWYG_003943 [Pedobacter sp. UYEF25]
MEQNQDETPQVSIVKLENTIEKVPLGSIVSNFAHPYTSSNTNVLISTYAHFTPPLMVVVEKKYGNAYNSISGEKENDSYKCLYYSTINGAFELNWFKTKEIKIIQQENNIFFRSNRNKTIEVLKRELFGKTVILTSVDLELEKTKIWSDNDGDLAKLKTSNLLDFLPPLGSVIDVKYNDDYQKYDEKDGTLSYRKSKVTIKVRWLNNITSKYSEEYVPLVSLKIVDINLKEFNLIDLYLDGEPLLLEDNSSVEIKSSPIEFKDVIWKHYYYIYRFKNLFTKQIISVKDSGLVKLAHLNTVDSEKAKLVFDSPPFNYINIFNFFKSENRASWDKKWFEIQYSDKNEKYSKRIIYVSELIEESLIESGKKRILIKANCLLRRGAIRHFNVSRIRAYREMPKDYETIFVK